MSFLQLFTTIFTALNPFFETKLKFREHYLKNEDKKWHNNNRFKFCNILFNDFIHNFSYCI
jgi:hypothetical protein